MVKTKTGMWLKIGKWSMSLKPVESLKDPHYFHGERGWKLLYELVGNILNRYEIFGLGRECASISTSGVPSQHGEAKVE